MSNENKSLRQQLAELDKNRTSLYLDTKIDNGLRKMRVCKHASDKMRELLKNEDFIYFLNHICEKKLSLMAMWNEIGILADSQLFNGENPMIDNLWMMVEEHNKFLKAPIA